MEMVKMTHSQRVQLVRSQFPSVSEYEAEMIAFDWDDEEFGTTTGSL